MARTRPPVLQKAQLNIEQMQTAISKLDRRINELEAFDVNLIRERWDPIIDALAKKVDGTLQDIYGHGTIEYNQYAVHTFDTLPVIMGGGPDPLPLVKDGYREGIERVVLTLKTLKELFEERIADTLPSSKASARFQQFPGEGSRRVFVVHGHDDGSKETVARYLSKLDLQPIILHEQANAGHTIIEKFEAHADVEFAVVLFTPDDVGYPIGKAEQAKPRARQNVVLELGFFMGKLARKRVCALFKGDVELPSDYSGVIYIALDDGGAWRFALAREIKSAGIEVDLNKAM